MSISVTEFAASFLYDSGWRAEDKDDLIREYDLTNEAADAICEKLAEYANK